MSAGSDTGKLADRVALVVGASRGIGAAIARALAAEGAAVAISARSDAALAHVAASIASDGGRVHSFVGDVSASATAADAVASTKAALGPIDILVYAAGISAVGRFEELPDDRWRDLYEVNVLGAVRFSRAVVPEMRERGWGRIINVASTAAKYGSLYQSPYNATKHAMLGLTRCLALELAADGVTVNAICPGFVDTEMLDNGVPEWARLHGLEPEAVLPTLLTRVPIKRLIEPGEVAELACYLASPAAGGLTGQGLTLAGGLILI